MSINAPSQPARSSLEGLADHHAQATRRNRRIVVPRYELYGTASGSQTRIISTLGATPIDYTTGRMSPRSSRSLQRGRSNRSWPSGSRSVTPGEHMRTSAGAVSPARKF
jgi:hypothetical protein